MDAANTELSPDLKGRTPDQQEEWFLESLDRDPLPVRAMLQLVRRFADQGETSRARSCAELLQDALVETDMHREAFKLLVLRANWRAGDESFRADARRIARRQFSDRHGKAMVDNCGFEDGLPLEECLRRLWVLIRLEAGIFCHDKTWGFGTIKQVDPFYARVRIDFSKKRGHEMSFRYAAETLDLVSDDHLLARQARDADAFQALLADDPAEIVRITIRSFGEVSVPRLKELLVDDVMPEGDWKAFWDKARKELKKDPLIEIPAKRNDKVRMLAREKAYDLSWFEHLAKERKLKTIMDLIDEVDKERDLTSLDDRESDILVDRLRFVLLGAEGQDYGMLARVLMTAHRLGLDEELGGFAVAERALFSIDGFLMAARSVPARMVAPLIRYLLRLDDAAMEITSLGALNVAPFGILSELIAFLREQGQEAECAGRLRNVLMKDEASVAVLYWICRNDEPAREWSLVEPDQLLRQIVIALEADCSGDDLKTQNQLRTMMEQREWLAVMLARLSEVQREQLMVRIRDSHAWQETARRSVLAAMIKLYPELQATMTGGRAAAPAKRGRFTSWRSYSERQAQFKKLVEEDIPANSKEIAHARSYGDLRENFEYQAAKDHQRILLQRKQEMESDLGAVRGTDFGSSPSERAGMGTEVTVRGADGGERRYVILGEWDRDEALGIISSKSAVALKLEGARPGDTVELPSEHGQEACSVVAVDGLSDEVRAWIAG